MALYYPNPTELSDYDNNLITQPTSVNYTPGSSSDVTINGFDLSSKLVITYKRLADTPLNTPTRMITLKNGSYIEYTITRVRYGWPYYEISYDFSLKLADGTHLIQTSSYFKYLLDYHETRGVIFIFFEDRNVALMCYQWENNTLYSQSTLSDNNITIADFLAGATPSADIIGTGGGATHIAKVTGALSALSSNLSDVLIVAGGGGGGLVADGTPTTGANAGGISGSGNNSANQSTGYAFGQGEASGGGGGLYGGYKAANGDSGGAGSGYIGNELLGAKKMVGYNVPTSDTASTKTESVNVYSATAEENKPKAGNGFAKITWLRDLT